MEEKISIPTAMLQHIKQHGEPEAVITYIITQHLHTIKKVINEDQHLRNKKIPPDIKKTLDRLIFF